MSPEEKKPSQQYFSLQPSEKAVFQCASQIYAAYICAGKVTEDNRKEYHKIAIKDAIRIGQMVEKAIESDDELPAAKGT